MNRRGFLALALSAVVGASVATAVSEVVHHHADVGESGGESEDAPPLHAEPRSGRQSE